jgi:hypothetical protein
VKRKKNQSFFQIRIMFMPWGCLKNEFGCYQFKVSFGINEGFIDYFSHFILYKIEKCSLLLTFHVIDLAGIEFCGTRLLLISSQGNGNYFLFLLLLPSPCSYCFLTDFHVKDCRMNNVIYFFFYEKLLMIPCYVASIYNSIV